MGDHPSDKKVNPNTHINLHFEPHISLPVRRRHTRQDIHHQSITHTSPEWHLKLTARLHPPHSSATSSPPSNPTRTAPNPSRSPPPSHTNSRTHSSPTSPSPTNTSLPTSPKPTPSSPSSRNLPVN